MLKSIRRALMVVSAIVVFAAASATIVQAGPPVATPAPTGVSATPSNGAVIVNWVAPSSKDPITQYIVTATPGGATSTLSAGTGIPTTAVVPALTNGTGYTFTVKSVNVKGTSLASTASASVKPATVPAAPTGITVTGLNAAASVGWVAPTNTGGSAVTKSFVSCNNGAFQAWVNAPASTTTVTGLTNDTVYTCTVQAFNAIGPSTASTSLTVTPKASAM